MPLPSVNMQEESPPEWKCCKSNHFRAGKARRAGAAGKKAKEPARKDRLPEGRSETTSHASPEIGLGGDRGDVDPALNQRIDERADDFSAVQRAAVGPGPDVFVQVGDLPIEEHHGDLRPRLLMHGRPASGPFDGCAGCSPALHLARWRGLYQRIS